MREYSATTMINASPEVIWKILTDGSKYPEWEPDTHRIEGTIAAGEKMKVFARRNPKFAFQVEVIEFEPWKKMVWNTGVVLGLIRGVRSFTLVEQEDKVVKYTLREQLSGPLLFLFARQIPDFDSIFAASAAALKVRAEGAQDGAG
ncbi:MAG: SRPBCC domain-containing protein [Chloroflexota bacterium]